MGSVDTLGLSNRSSPVTTSFHQVFVLYPQFTQLDFTGPYEVLTRLPGARCTLASATGGKVGTDSGLSFQTVALADLADCDLICVPGGLGCAAAMQDASLLAELRRLSQGARYITSVCTGSLILAAAGLLKGRRSACHWAWLDLLAEFDGVTPDAARTVRDGRFFSGGGVTAGIDMALVLMADVAGIEHARRVQLMLEYAPDPPFDCGRPERADAALVAAVRERLQHLAGPRREAVRRAAQALQG